MQYVLWIGTAVCALVVIPSLGWRQLVIAAVLTLLVVTLVTLVFSGWVAGVVGVGALWALSGLVKRLMPPAQPREDRGVRSDS